MKLINWLSEYASTINQIWFFTISGMFALYIICNVLPDRWVGRLLPLHNVFKPSTNIDLNYQSIGYAMLHRSLFSKITHASIIIESVLWFVVFQTWHWSISLVVLIAIVIQSVFIGDRKFAIFFILAGILSYLASQFGIKILGLEQAALLSKLILMLGGLMRMLSHSAELIPPILLNDSDQFQKLTAKNINLRVLLASPIGYVAEFSSSLPNRLLPVQVNYLYQNILKIKPQTTQSWKDIDNSAQLALNGGYKKLSGLRKYYESVMNGE
jgi:hypothetical protein